MNKWAQEIDALRAENVAIKEAIKEVIDGAIESDGSDVFSEVRTDDLERLASFLEGMEK